MSEPSSSLLLLLLLSSDLAIMVFHVILETIAAEQCHVLGVCGYIHIYNLIKLTWIVVLFAYVLKSTGCSSYASWMLVFTYFFLDDALLIHQKVGDHLSNIFMFNHAAILDFGSRFFELAVLAITGLFLLSLVAWAYSHGPHEFRKSSKDILLFIAALVFFGLVVDIATPLKLGRRVLFILGLIEDGGEMMVLSLIVWYVFLLAICKGKPDLFLHELMFKSKPGVVFDQ